LTHQAEIYPDLDLAPLDTAGLDVRDAAFAHAIYDAVLRRWITLGYLVEGYLSRPFADLDPRLRAVLLAGAAQMLLLDKVPPHAALNESVQWAKDNVKPAAGGLVNAVLRKIAALVFGEQAGLPQSSPKVAWSRGRDEVPLPDGSALKLREPVFPAAMPERIAIATGHPVALLKKWAGAWGEDEAARLAAHGLINPPTILNTQFASSPVPSCVAHERPSPQVWTGGRSELVALLESRQDVWVQDSSSALAVQSIANLTPEIVVDLCAGQGTKTRQLAATFPNAQIIASDVDRRRLITLREVASMNPRIKVVAPEEVRSQLSQRADLVLLDVPCSNTGVLPRRVEARYRCDSQQLSRLVTLQREILSNAMPLLAPGAAILYSTCSIEPEENEEQVAWAQKELGLTPSHLMRTMPAGGPGESPSGYHDGAFSALLTR
jgi:16S rRNA (cytosine967-C5)-methyltransferase